MNFTCLLCDRAGLPTLAPRHRRTSICTDHRESLNASGRGWCERGMHAVPLGEWRRGVCRGCDNARRSAAYHADPEPAREAARRHYEANRAARIAYIRAWKAANPEKCRLYERRYMRKWRKANPERHQANNARYRARHRLALREKWRLYRRRRLLRILRGA